MQDEHGLNEFIPLTPWLSRIEVSIAKSRKIKGGNYVQIATVASDGLPHCRTVVFRGFSKIGSTSLMRMITDARSEKVQQITDRPACEMVWWFSQSSEQYRIRGNLILVGPNTTGELQEARNQQWKQLSDPGTFVEII